MSAICQRFGIKPQAHYQMKKRQERKEETHAQVLEMVKAIRHKHKRIGTRKLLVMLREDLTTAGIQIGRDQLFALLGSEKLLVPAKRRQTRTTWSGVWRCDNLVANTTLTRPNQVWVSDITYVATEGNFAYLALVTDLFSRRIIGYDLSDTLAAEGALRAFNMAVKQAGGRHALKDLIHHSDHGIQYTCRLYRDRLQQLGVRLSMGQVGNCYDNAVAERVNGILKIEYGLDERFVSHRHALQATREAIWLYNHQRPHLSLDYAKPHDIYIKYTKCLNPDNYV
jgi:transposase InsO family protein